MSTTTSNLETSQTPEEVTLGGTYQDFALFLPFATVFPESGMSTPSVRA